jgi:hypothetical protein
LSKPEDKLLISFVKNLSGSLWSTIAVVVVVSCIAVAIAVNAFGLRVSGGLALYFVIWWILLFAVLPFGVRSQAESGEVVHRSRNGRGGFSADWPLIGRRREALKRKARLSPCLNCLLAIFDPWLSKTSASWRLEILFLPKLGP